MRRGRRPVGLAAIVALACCGASPVRAEQTRVATTAAADVQDGEARDLAVSSRGRLFLAPRVTPFGKAIAAGFPSQVFAAAADDAGNLFLATGPDGAVVKINRAGESSVWFRADEPLITAVLPLASGEILAAAAPGGKIYKIGTDGKGVVWCDTDERYVWALVADKAGAVFAATGDRGRLLRIDRNGNPAVFFDSDETHLVSLVAGKDGVLWAGGSARGLVYRIDAEGHGLVVYDDELPEAKSIVLTRSGDLAVAFDAPPVTEKRPPALRLRMAGSAAAPNETMGDFDTRQTPALSGVIEGLPSIAPEESLPLRGKVVRIGADGTTVELWRSRSETPFAVALDDKERVIFATGEPAALWRVESPGDIARIAALPEAQATAFARAGGALVASTSNPAAAYRVEHDAADAGTYLARPLDAGSVARWGTLSWRRVGAGGRVELFTRTGNCEEPDGTWSAWSAAQTEASGSPVTNPDGRFLQWRTKISGADDGSGIASVAVTYATRNRPPSLRDLRVEPASGVVAAKATFRWSAGDPDGDGVAVDIQGRLSGASAWKSAVRTDPPPAKPSDPTLGNDASSKDGKATWDTAGWDEGLYEIRGVASDQPSNPPEEALEADSELPLLVRVDRTPPSIEAKRSGGNIEVVVTDAISPVARLEVVVDGRVAFSPRALDGVCDGLRETFRIPAAELTPPGTWSLKATDAAGNAVETAVPAP